MTRSHVYYIKDAYGRMGAYVKVAGRRTNEPGLFYRKINSVIGKFIWPVKNMIKDK